MMLKQTRRAPESIGDLTLELLLPDRTRTSPDLPHRDTEGTILEGLLSAALGEVPLWRGPSPKLSRNVVTLLLSNNDDPLNIKGIKEMKKTSLGHGTLPLSKTDTKIAATSSPPLDPQKESDQKQIFHILYYLFDLI